MIFPDDFPGSKADHCLIRFRRRLCPVMLSTVVLASAGVVSGQENATAPGGSVAPRYHTLQRGESLRYLAHKYGVSVLELARANSIDDVNKVYTGEQIRIPGRPQARPARPAPPRRNARPTGRFSLTFSNIDVRDALAQIAQYARTDIVVTPGTTGIVSINLRNRTPDEAIRP